MIPQAGGQSCAFAMRDPICSRLRGGSPPDDAICAGEVGRAAGPADAASHARSSAAATDQVTTPVLGRYRAMSRRDLDEIGADEIEAPEIADQTLGLKCREAARLRRPRPWRIDRIERVNIEGEIGGAATDDLSRLRGRPPPTLVGGNRSPASPASVRASGAATLLPRRRAARSTRAALIDRIASAAPARNFRCSIPDRKDQVRSFAAVR
jgi:hypothetical protein